ncbi:putative sigma E regulatory protein, MucB/RseB [Candidatus Vecturithrix granuli]|uniref:Putative sigma E regulatory protein, MucB/RseB n=1 Tax=Vecturithrix granuli TaxID=1499967 RepID=A0A081C863_VECG1|nr:putative sigma E regulatory protein, MucB/RseB [Candidatus Vecturithrix granuli]
MKNLMLCLTLLLCAGPVTAQTLTGQEILQKVDANMAVDQAVSMSTMIVHGRSGSRTITSKSWNKGRDKAFVEYLSPAREKGKKMLKLGDKIWTYTPEPTDRIITISGHLLRQSVMGSDLSYEDVTENDHLVDLYDAEVIAEDEINGQHCYVLQLRAKEQDISYHSRKLWVDSEHWLPLKEERYAKSGKLLKTIEIIEIFQVAERWYPKKMIFKDVLSSGKGTEYLIDSIEFDVEVPDHLLTQAALRK